MEKKLEKMFSAYHYAGGYELFFKTGAFTEQIFEKYDGKIPELFTHAPELLKTIRKVIDAQPGEYHGISITLESMRNDIEAEMRNVVELRDNLRVSLYVLKRLAEPEPEKPMDVNKESSAIINLMFRNTEQTAVREAVRNTVASLPLRIARSKFFDIVESALETQLSRSEKEIDELISNIEGYAGLKVSGNGAMIDKDASEAVDIVFSKDFDAASREEIEELYKRTLAAAERTDIKIDALSDIGLMINSLLLELSAAGHIGKSAGEIYANADVTGFVKKLIDAFESGDRKAFEEGLVYEGIDESELEKLEELRLKIPGYEDGFIAMAGEESEEIFRDAKRCVTLISDSVFGSLDTEEAVGKIVDRDMIMLKAKELKQKLTDAFAVGSKLLQRARMSGVLSRLPLFLNNSNEVKDYVMNSLSSCRDEKEKAVAIREIKEYFSDIV